MPVTLQLPQGRARLRKTDGLGRLTVHTPSSILLPSMRSLSCPALRGRLVVLLPHPVLLLLLQQTLLLMLQQPPCSCRVLLALLLTLLLML